MFTALVTIVVALLVVLIFIGLVGLFAPKDVDPLTGRRNSRRS
mgnify:CR=1 FL=1